jgi:hypothetical protein
MPKDGDRRKDGFVWGGSRWRSPKGFTSYRKSQRRYMVNNYRLTKAMPSESLNRGWAGEHLVLSELLFRQLNVGVPVNPQTAHDLFVHVDGKWVTVQVKLGRLNTRTRTITPNNCGKVSSDLIALVDLEGKRIRWISNTDEAVPAGLL